MVARRRGQAGFTLAELLIAISIIAVLAAFALPNLLEARRDANDAAAISTLRSLYSAQHIFQSADKDRNGTNEYASSLADLGAVALIDAQLTTGTRQGYIFAILPGADYSFWAATATPAVPGRSGGRYFYVDQSGVIRYSTSATATSLSTAVGG